MVCHEGNYRWDFITKRAYVDKSVEGALREIMWGRGWLIMGRGGGIV